MANCEVPQSPLWVFDPTVLFSSILELRASVVAATENSIFSSRLVVLSSDVVEGHALYYSVVVAAEVTNLPMFSCFSSDLDLMSRTVVPFISLPLRLQFRFRSDV